MHRSSLYCWLLPAAALYVSLAGCATPPGQPPAQVPAQIETPAEAAPGMPLPQVQPPAQVEAPPLIEPKTLAQMLRNNPNAHIALLLPLKSPAFGQAADAVQQGFLAAAGSQRTVLPIKVYGSIDESKDIVTLYQRAIAGGAVAVVGPLTRDAVSVLADYGEIPVPTLALNVIESEKIDNLYFFTLPMEAEARQVAQLAAAAKLRYATIVSTGTPMSKRLSLAFAEEWKFLGGTITAEILYHDDPAALALLPTMPGDGEETIELPPPVPGGADADYIPPPTIAPGNMVFLAAEVEKARVIRPYLNAALPVYATSQLFNGNADIFTNYDLDDIYFVSMPWLLQPDHPAVMVYPRADPPLDPDLERLYALGIDAFRLLNILLNNGHRPVQPLDGVTGYIRLIYNQFQRDAILAQIKQGRSQIIRSSLPRLPSTRVLP